MLHGLIMTVQKPVYIMVFMIYHLSVISYSPFSYGVLIGASSPQFLFQYQLNLILGTPDFEDK
jgi:hypothetical protein